ncbi:MAG: Rrf2 family transcriptional regulator [Anaerolineales bacterium]|nr:Rrf2 family transcriptional regulator [Anaerolineales bacterium]
MNTNQRFAISVHALTLLAANADPLTSEAIASSVGTNPVVIRRTMASLRELDIVESKSGTNGGWSLAREPKKIGLCEVYRSLGEVNVLTVHGHPNKLCSIGGNISGVLQSVFDDAQSELEKALAGYTVADILKDVLKKANGSA